MERLFWIRSFFLIWLMWFCRSDLTVVGPVWLSLSEEWGEGRAEKFLWCNFSEESEAAPLWVLSSPSSLLNSLSSSLHNCSLVTLRLHKVYLFKFKLENFKFLARLRPFVFFWLFDFPFSKELLLIIISLLSFKSFSLVNNDDFS